MKKFLYLIVAVGISAITANAQTVAGSKFIGGGLTYTSDKVENSNIKNTSVTFSPSGGYFLADNLAVGLILSISSTKNEPSGNKTSGFGVGPFARYYMHTSNENFAFFAQAALVYTAGKQQAATTVNTSSIDFALSPGFAYFFNEHWSAELMFRGIGFNSYDPNTDTNNNKVTTFDIGLNSLSPSLGVRYYF